MRYFKYQYSKSLGNIWQLFSDLKDAQQEVLKMKDSFNKCDYSHTDQIISSAMNGNLKYEEFHLKSYEMACQINENATKFNKSFKEMSIVDDVPDGSKEAPRKINTVSIGKFGVYENNFDELFKADDFEKDVQALLNLRWDYLSSEGFDPVVVLRNSLKGVPEALKILEGIKDEKLKSLYSSLLSYGNTARLVGRLEV